VLGNRGFERLTKRVLDELKVATSPDDQPELCKKVAPDDLRRVQKRRRSCEQI